MFRMLALLLLLFQLQSVPSGKNIPRVHIVEFKGMRLVPEVLAINKGDTVIWVNKDLVTHNVTEKTGSWASPSILRNKQWKRSIRSTTDYYCSLHPVMKGRIEVKR